jgi:hypothetical protein
MAATGRHQSAVIGVPASSTVPWPGPLNTAVSSPASRRASAAGSHFLYVAVVAAEDDDGPARLCRGEPVGRQLCLLIGDQVVVIAGDTVSRQDVVHEALESRLVPRIVRGEEEVRRPGVVGGGQAAAVGQRLIAVSSAAVLLPRHRHTGRSRRESANWPAQLASRDRLSLHSAGLIGAAPTRILDQAGLAAYARLKYRNVLIHCYEVRQNLSATQNREFCREAWSPKVRSSAVQSRSVLEQ